MNPSIRRALLVARREFLENVRTRGFWLSMATVPVVLLISLAVPIASELARPVLTFAVTDESGWVLERIVDRADKADLRHLLTTVDASAADAPAPLSALLAHSRDLDEGDRAGLVERLVEAPREGAEAEFIDWWRRLQPPAMARLDPQAWRARFYLVHPPQRWTPAGEALANLAADRVFAWIRIPEDPVGRPGEPTEAVRYTATNLTNLDLRRWFTDALAWEVERQRRREGGVDGRVYDWVAARPEVDMRTLDARGGAEGERSASARDVLNQWGPVAFVYILWISILMVTQMLMTSTVEEKSNKLVEVLLASLSPIELMTGKIAGIAATGLSIVLVWIATFVGAAVLLPALLGAPASLDLSGLATNPVYLGSFVLYFLLGYLLYAALLAALGSVCNTLKEAQTLAIPVQGILFVPLVVMIPIGRDPSGTLASVLTWIPPFTPFVMMNRAAQPPDAWVYVGTTLLLMASIVAVTWMGAKVFRVGILMSGQPPGLRELLRWVRAPVAAVATAAAPAPAARRTPPD
ncbi:MAG TPA: ABC transporter permease [Pseudomonadales bacterium]|nr:ABC transporter permease [Pseudomonadales bacterium]